MRRPRRSAVGAAVLALGVAACGPAASAAHDVGPAPRVVMVGPGDGYAVWPSGARWVVLGSSDGWRTVQDLTPLAVPTDGGLVLSSQGAQLSVAVLPHRYLTVSPVLTSPDHGRTWSPGQLPGAVLASATALAHAAGEDWAVLADGQVVARPPTAERWTQVTSPERLAPGGSLTLTGVVPGGEDAVLLTGTSRSGGDVLFRSDDRGSTWQPSGPRPPTPSAGAVTALAPCRVGSTWVAPVVANSSLVAFSASDLDGPWVPGPPLAVSGLPVVTCGPSQLWAAIPRGRTDQLVTITPGGGWQVRGDLGVAVASLSVDSSDHAFAATAPPARLISVQLGARLQTARVDLPGWVATVGGSAMRN